MNIEQARTIPITLILDKINLTPQRKKNHEVWYLSPLRNEKTASFKVNTKTNTWWDFGIGEGGDIIDYARQYLKSQGFDYAVTDALRYINNTSGYVPFIKPVDDEDHSKDDKALHLRNVTDIKRLGLIQYAANRGIPESVIKEYLKEVYVHNSNSDKVFYALGMRNEEAGYELRNPQFKGCVRKKHITFIRGLMRGVHENNYEGIHIFEGFMDFLTVITQQEGAPMKDDVIILHSLSCLKHGAAYIRGFGYKKCYTYMDNDQPGIQATASWKEFCSTQENLTHIPMNKNYAPYKDVNAYHMAKLELKG